MSRDQDQRRRTRLVIAEENGFDAGRSIERAEILALLSAHEADCKRLGAIGFMSLLSAMRSEIQDGLGRDTKYLAKLRGE